MLKQRLITAAVLIPLVVFGIFQLETSELIWPVAIISAMAAWEWLSIIGIHDVAKRITSLLALVVIASLTWLWLPVEAILVLGLVLWLFVTKFIMNYGHQGLPDRLQTRVRQQKTGIISAIVMLTLFWIAILTLHESTLGPHQLLYIMVVVWLADTGGYFAGKRWGKTPLAKAVSPNKTWEGVAGALVLSTIWSLLAYSFGINGEISFIVWLLITLLTMAVSIVGDLFESLFKRSFNVKDSGRLLPGHGGILDRIDSLISAIPFFTASLIVIGAI